MLMRAESSKVHAHTQPHVRATAIEGRIHAGLPGFIFAMTKSNRVHRKNVPHSGVPRYQTRGMTLIELLVTLAVAAVVLAMAITSFSQLTANNRMTTAVNTLVSSLQLARSEAVKRGQPMSLCPDNPATTAYDCTGAKNWHVGYIVFLDPAGNGALASQDNVIRAQETFTDTPITIIGDEATLTYNADGTVDKATDFAYCDTAGITNFRTVSVTSVGYVSTTRTESPTCP